MSKKMPKKIIEELQKEHEGGATLKYSECKRRDRPFKRSHVVVNGDVHQSQRDKVVRVTHNPKTDDEN